jgi:hypothetical protein
MIVWGYPGGKKVGAVLVYYVVSGVVVEIAALGFESKPGS